MIEKISIEVVTPTCMFYKGNITSLVVKTCEGFEGFLAYHTWCVKLLPEDGEFRIRETDGTEHRARIRNGYVEVRDRIVIFTDEAEWIERDSAKTT